MRSAGLRRPPLVGSSSSPFCLLFIISSSSLPIYLFVCSSSSLLVFSYPFSSSSFSSSSSPLCSFFILSLIYRLLLFSASPLHSLFVSSFPSSSFSLSCSSSPHFYSLLLSSVHPTSSSLHLLFLLSSPLFLLSSASSLVVFTFLHQRGHTRVRYASDPYLEPAINTCLPTPVFLSPFSPPLPLLPLPLLPCLPSPTLCPLPPVSCLSPPLPTTWLPTLALSYCIDLQHSLSIYLSISFPTFLSPLPTNFPPYPSSSSSLPHLPSHILPSLSISLFISPSMASPTSVPFPYSSP